MLKARSHAEKCLTTPTAAEVLGGLSGQGDAEDAVEVASDEVSGNRYEPGKDETCLQAGNAVVEDVGDAVGEAGDDEGRDAEN